jgi:hypothetical protein
LADGATLALSDDRSRLLVGHGDGTVGVWEIDWALAARRRGPPRYTEVDVHQLLRELGHAGYGWLDPDGVRRRLAEYH